MIKAIDHRQILIFVLSMIPKMSNKLVSAAKLGRHAYIFLAPSGAPTDSLQFQHSIRAPLARQTPVNWSRRSSSRIKTKYIISGIDASTATHRIPSLLYFLALTYRHHKNTDPGGVLHPQSRAYCTPMRTPASSQPVHPEFGPLETPCK